MTSKYGDLERYLGSKYAQDLSDSPDAMAAYEDSHEILYGSMDVLSMFSKVNLAMQDMMPNAAQS